LDLKLIVFAALFRNVELLGSVTMLQNNSLVSSTQQASTSTSTSTELLCVA